MSASGRRPGAPSGREVESGLDSHGGRQAKWSPESLLVEHDVPLGVWSEGTGERDPDFDMEGGHGGGLGEEDGGG